jgi:hypothetical protein
LGVNVPALYALLQRVHDVFERVAAITEKESNEHLLPTRFLMARAHAAWLAAVRLGMSGQVVETYPLVRMVVENSWYALHLAKDRGRGRHLEGHRRGRRRRQADQHVRPGPKPKPPALS